LTCLFFWSNLFRMEFCFCKTGFSISKKNSRLKNIKAGSAE
jgi:hypothetical protein